MSKRDFCVQNLVVFHEGIKNGNDAQVIKYIITKELKYGISNYSYIRALGGKNKLLNIINNCMSDKSLNISKEIFKLSNKQKGNTAFPRWKEVKVLIIYDENGSGYENIVTKEMKLFLDKQKIKYFSFIPDVEKNLNTNKSNFKNKSWKKEIANNSNIQKLIKILR